MWKNFKSWKTEHLKKIDTWYCVLHVTTITLFWFVTFIHTYAQAHTYTHTHTHTHTHTQRNTHTDLNFAGFWKDCKIKYTRNWDNDGPQNLIHAKFKFLIKTSDLRKILGKLRETKIFALTKQNNWKLQGEEIYFWRSFMLLACNFIKKWTLSQDYLKDFA